MVGQRDSRLEPGSRSSGGGVAQQGEMAGPPVAVLGARASRLRPRCHELPQIGYSMAGAVETGHHFEKRGILSKGVGSKNRSDVMADEIADVGRPHPPPLLPAVVPVPYLPLLPSPLIWPIRPHHPRVWHSRIRPRGFHRRLVCYRPAPEDWRRAPF